MDKIKIPVKRLPHAADLPMPFYATEESAGMDIPAAVPQDAPITLAVGQRGLIPTGLEMALPAGFEAQIRPRSGLAVKHGITVLNSPGTIDSDYRNEVQVILINHGTEPFTIQRGERIAQMIIAPITQAVLTETDTLPATARTGGFGSTGVKT